MEQKTIRSEEGDTLYLRSTWEQGNPSSVTTATGTRTFHVGLPPNAQVNRAVVEAMISGVGAYGSNYSECRIAETPVSAATSSGQSAVSARISVQGSRDVEVLFLYKANYLVAGSQYTVTFADIKLVIDYELIDEDEEGYPDEEPLIPVKGVVLYNADGSGGIKLQPISCIVIETANGEYELEMEHPVDARSQLIDIDKVLDVPVPPFRIPEVTMPPATVWKVKTSVSTTKLYSRLPTYTSSKSAPQWISTKSYQTGDKVSYVGTVWQAARSSTGTAPGSSASEINGIWVEIQSQAPVYNPGTVIENLSGGSLLVYIAPYNSTYIKVRSQLGRTGYVAKSDCEETGNTTQTVYPEKIVYRQKFRVYDTTCEEGSGVLAVSARHISYDSQGNALFDCKMQEEEPATAIAILQGDTVADDPLTIISPLETPAITADWSFSNPIQALLDPDEGLAAQLRAKVLRDNHNIYILSNDSMRRGPRLAYGVNLRGVTWERNSEEVITRVIPRAKNGDDYLYLDELYIDSPYISQYATPHIEILDSDYSIGQKIKKADDTEITLSRSDVLERMREEAENRFFVDKADAITVTLDVDFILLGDTEEYRQFKNLQRVNLFDRIRIDTGTMTISAQVTEYEWDCLLSRYNAITVSRIYDMARRAMPGYRLAGGSITYGKLAPGLISRIRGDEN